MRNRTLQPISVLPGRRTQSTECTRSHRNAPGREWLSSTVSPLLLSAKYGSGRARPPGPTALYRDKGLGRTVSWPDKSCRAPYKCIKGLFKKLGRIFLLITVLYLDTHHSIQWNVVSWPVWSSPVQCRDPHWLVVEHRDHDPCNNVCCRNRFVSSCSTLNFIEADAVSKYKECLRKVVGVRYSYTVQLHRDDVRN